MKIRFEIGGRILDPCFVGDPVDKAILLFVGRQIKKRIGPACDRQAGRSLRIVVRGDDIEHLSYEFEGSQRLIQLAKPRLSN